MGSYIVGRILRSKQIKDTFISENDPKFHPYAEINIMVNFGPQINEVSYSLELVATNGFTLT